MEKEYSFPEIYAFFDESMQAAFDGMNDYCLENRYGVATPEHLLKSMLDQPPFRRAFLSYCSNVAAFEADLDAYLSEQERIPEDMEAHCSYSHQLLLLIRMALVCRDAAEVDKAKASHVVFSMYELDDSLVAYLLKRYLSDKADFLAALIEGGGSCLSPESSGSDVAGQSERLQAVDAFLETLHPMVGREKEMEQLVQILCRKDTHHALLVGEAGVGKSTIAYELARRLKEGRLPERFAGGCFYRMNLKAVLSGVQTRADLDRRVSDALQSVSGEDVVFVFVDQMQMLSASVARQNEESDLVSLLKPYLDWDGFRFLCTCSPSDYNKGLSNQPSLSRYFQKIDVAEPSADDSVKILGEVLPAYEKYHRVSYSSESVAYAVSATSKHIRHQFLPQKAIALLDDAGAYLVSHPDEPQVVGVPLLSQLLSKVCGNDSLLLDEASEDRLSSLESRILSKIYGQDEAVRRIVENVQMAKAGLLDDNKPLASFLFVGPTGVGKTEVASVLAKELGVELVRFDMSEYVEQFTVSKLIGSPAGYVGYDEGGLLTEAVRRNPSCVLLLDEIEKAHDSIYNILLQVMDYARLTDNKGNHADFRNVVLIMTSNAGAQFAMHASVGFVASVSPGDVMLKQVKKTFKPEFLNRLTASVVFRSMDGEMAGRVLTKKLDLLSEKLAVRKTKMQVTEEAREFLMKEGFSKTYGAREMDRAINTHLKPLLTREILFGKLRNGGVAVVGVQDGKLALV